MPITEIIIENFKGVGARVEIPIRPITLLFGANSAGKSTVLQALLYLRELLERRNADADQLLAGGTNADLGGFREFVHARRLENKITVGINLRLDADGLPIVLRPAGCDVRMPYSDPELDQVEEAGVEVEVEWSPSHQRTFITKYRVFLDGVAFACASAIPGNEAQLDEINSAHPIFGPPEIDNDDTSYPGDVLGMVQSVFPQAWNDSGTRGPIRQRILMGASVIPDFKLGLPMVWGDQIEEDKTVTEWVFTLVNRAVTGAGRAVLDELQKIRYIGPIRRIPERNFQPMRSPDEARWADGSGAWDLVAMKNTDRQWLDAKAIQSLGLGLKIDNYRYFEIPKESLLGVILERASSNVPSGEELDLDSIPASELLRLRERSRIQLISEANDLELQPCEVGIGVSQVLPVALGAMAPGYRILVVEQPELHIHPAIQCNLGDLLAAQAIKDESRTMLLETHSEHLILRMLRRIRENTEGALLPDAPPLKPKHLSVLWVQQDDGAVLIKPIPVNAQGDFDEQWPKGFFEERFDEYE